MLSTSLEEQVYGALGETSYEKVGRAAIEAISILRAGTLVGAWFERREVGGEMIVLPQFALRVLGGEGEFDLFDYGGRRGIRSEPRCPFISIFVRYMPCELAEDHHVALLDVCGPKLVDLRATIDLILAMTATTTLLGGRADQIGRA